MIIFFSLIVNNPFQPKQCVLNNFTYGAVIRPPRKLAHRKFPRRSIVSAREKLPKVCMNGNADDLVVAAKPPSPLCGVHQNFIGNFDEAHSIKNKSYA